MSRRYVYLDYEPSQGSAAFHHVTYEEIRAWVWQEYGLKVFSNQVTHIMDFWCSMTRMPRRIS